MYVYINIWKRDIGRQGEALPEGEYEVRERGKIVGDSSGVGHVERGTRLPPE